jgi:sulfatase maturation enzyme AslB (radical SAM superfamily)
MKKFFLTSLEVEFELCNLRCQYCWLTSGNLETFRKGDQILSRQKGEVIRFDYSVSSLSQNIRHILEKSDSYLLKVSGGEIFLLPEVIEELILASSKFDKILLVSNGTVMKQQDLEKLDPNKFCFQISLDGHIGQANILRYKEATQNTEKVLKTVSLLYEQGFVSEISCVLTDYNIQYLIDFCEYFAQHFPTVTIIPFPVRFSDYKLSSSKENISVLSHVKESFPPGTIPPRGYMEALIDTVKGQKKNTCFLPIIGLYGCEDGSSPLCPCGIIDNHQNIFEREVILPPGLAHPSVKRVLKKEEKYLCWKCKKLEYFNIWISYLI